MLVKIEEYDGDFISQSILEALELIGLVDKLNKLGYHISVEPIHGETPKGMVEDTPSKHKVVLARNKYIDKMTSNQFRKKKLHENYEERVFAEQETLFNIDFKQEGNATVQEELSVDGSNYVWYKHTVTLNFERPIMENIDAYIKGIFEKTADYLIQSIESTNRPQEDKA